MQVCIINLSFKVENEPRNVNKFAQNDPFRKTRSYNHTAERDSLAFPPVPNVLFGYKDILRNQSVYASWWGLNLGPHTC